MQSGTRLRGDHPAVRAHPEYFHLDGAAPEEIPHPLADVEHPRHEPVVRVLEQIPAEEAVTPADSFRVGGDFYLRDGPIVKQHPQLFETLPTPLSAA